MKLVLHAPNIHQGGGAGLLAALMASNTRGALRLVMVDARFAMPRELGREVIVKRVLPTFIGRLSAEWTLRRMTGPGDVVLCLGNLPPLFRLAARVTLFVQNRLLVANVPLREYRARTRLRLRAERLWLRARLSNAQRVVVQTSSMQRLVMDNLGARAEVLSFVPAPGANGVHGKHVDNAGARYDFLYVSSGEPHKNHVRLIAAWKLLAQENIRPRLGVTVSPIHDVELCRCVEDARAADGVDITNISVLAAESMHQVYAQAEAFIYPSTLESFGLPLLEAAAAGLPIIAAELDYVRDLLDPVQTFDPTSPLSIARAVKRYLGIADRKNVPLDAEGFLQSILKQA